MRRFIDFILALILIILTLPFWIVIIILLLIFSPGSPFFKHPRIGRNGKPFKLIKFRTMRNGPPNGLDITVDGDTRITGIGKVLRRCKLDELPQLLNILTGNMTFVGPRPEVAEYVRGYSNEQKDILNYKPGLVDPATLKYRNEEQILAAFENPREGYMQTVLPDKIKISLEYQKNRNIFTDLAVIFRTFGALFQKR